MRVCGVCWCAHDTCKGGDQMSSIALRLFALGQHLLLRSQLSRPGWLIIRCLTSSVSTPQCGITGTSLTFIRVLGIWVLFYGTISLVLKCRSFWYVDLDCVTNLLNRTLNKALWPSIFFSWFSSVCVHTCSCAHTHTNRSMHAHIHAHMLMHICICEDPKSNSSLIPQMPSTFFVLHFLRQISWLENLWID